MRSIKIYLKLLFNSIAGGLMIFIVSLLYMNCIAAELKWLGATLFSTGLISIFIFQFSLFTGKIGDARDLEDTRNLLIVFFGNVIGCLPSLLFNFSSYDIMSAKLDNAWYRIVVMGILCGMLITLSVEGWRRKYEWLTLLTIPTFILSGGEHCIADICFAFMCRSFSWETLLFISLVIIGNIMGSQIVSRYLENNSNNLL